jgi:hypothetical protein
LKNNKIISKEIHLKKRPAGLVTEDDFKLVDRYIVVSLLMLGFLK